MIGQFLATYCRHRFRTTVISIRLAITIAI